MEWDEQKMQEAAHLMVANLAGNLSLVTCKEPLRNSMAKQMQSLLMQQPITMQLPKQTVERIIQQCVNDNLKLGCSLIVKATSEKAKVEVDTRLKNQYSVRRATREQRGQQFEQRGAPGVTVTSRWHAPCHWQHDRARDARSPRRAIHVHDERRTPRSRVAGQ